MSLTAHARRSDGPESAGSRANSSSWVSRSGVFVQWCLARLDAQQAGQAGPGVPRLEEVADPGEGVAAPPEAGDELQPLGVPGPRKMPMQAAPLGRREQAHRVVFADRADRELRLAGEAVDGQPGAPVSPLVSVTVRKLSSH